MVDIHNFLNKEAWQEILKWEPPCVTLFVSFNSADLTFVLDRNSDPYLAKFRGKPGQLSPKARLLMFAGWLLPSRFKSVPTPFLHPIIHSLLTSELALDE